MDQPREFYDTERETFYADIEVEVHDKTYAVQARVSETQTCHGDKGNTLQVDWQYLAKTYNSIEIDVNIDDLPFTHRAAIYKALHELTEQELEIDYLAI